MICRADAANSLHLGDWLRRALIVPQQTYTQAPVSGRRPECLPHRVFSQLDEVVAVVA